MYFYRSLQPIKAITFDLDDTLYDNVPIIERAESALIQKLQTVSGLANLSLIEFNQLKQQMREIDAEIYHDVVAWRIMTLQHLFTKINLPASQIDNKVQEMMDYFTYWRHQIVVSSQTHQLLNRLAKHVPLAVITNGNVEVAKIGINHYFEFSLRGGIDGRSKPYSDTFTLAVNLLGVSPEHVLHVGDNLYTDVFGAVNAGMQACWLNLTGQDIYHQSEMQVLPHVEITNLAELENLL
ncbi:MAG: 5-amino-6-(5-phospho-D-ribitylamino)uracil phosphatase YigB [Candidatus Schmidhempelia sp.]|nr:5-amino-6-(5-phospho-D-ribitylamino)uracil phosphatase YigB [Candidatus Schmidhempelia sp.]